MNTPSTELPQTPKAPGCGVGFVMPTCPAHPFAKVIDRLGHLERPICGRVTESCCEGAPMG